MADIIIDWHAGTSFIRTGESALAYKHRLGHFPNSLDSQTVVKGMSSKINLKWKKELEDKLKTLKFYTNVPATVRVGRHRLKMHGTNRTKWVNNLANCLLRLRHSHKDRFGVANAESIINSVH